MTSTLIGELRAFFHLLRCWFADLLLTTDLDGKKTWKCYGCGKEWN